MLTNKTADLNDSACASVINLLTVIFTDYVENTKVRFCTNYCTLYWFVQKDSFISTAFLKLSGIDYKKVDFSNFPIQNSFYTFHLLCREKKTLANVSYHLKMEQAITFVNILQQH